MAIDFVRIEFPNRSQGKNACAKSAYISRSRIEFKGNIISGDAIYNFSNLKKPDYTEVLLPKGADLKFKNSEYLWNAAEQKETRINSRTYIDGVLALPNDSIITPEQKIELLTTFIQKYFVDKGVAVEVAIHYDSDNNCHAHFMIATRRFTLDGKELDKKARDLMPVIGGGKGTVADLMHVFWRNHQNEAFKKWNVDLVVDPNGFIPQKHLGCVRHRIGVSGKETENNLRIELNAIESKDPESILNALTKSKCIFSLQDLNRYLEKFVDANSIEKVKEDFLSHKNVVRLIEKESEKETDKFSSKDAINEEKVISYLADQIHKKNANKVNVDIGFRTFSKKLNSEQKIAYKNILKGSRISFIEGHAGTGKSYLLSALKDTYESKGYVVRGFGPDNATAMILKEIGIEKSENIHKFLYCLKNTRQQAKNGKNSISNQEVWLIDESGKISNEQLSEFLKVAQKNNAQLIFSGCSAQFDSVQRGGMFSKLSQKYGSELLENIQRQESLEDRKMTNLLAKGNVADAIDVLIANGGVRWLTDRNECFKEILKAWANDGNSCKNTMIIAFKNDDVDELNEMVHKFRKERGDLGEEFTFATSYGNLKMSVGDKIQLKGNMDSLKNGMKGTLIEASDEKITIQLEKSTEKISFSPKEYTRFKLGYAITDFSSQGGTYDRALVYHSKEMNKKATYVAGTRHKKNFFLFVPETETKNLAVLKWQTQRETISESTLDFTTKEDLVRDKVRITKDANINQLIESESMGTRIKGYSLFTWDKIVTKINTYANHYEILKPDKDFYSYKAPQKSELSSSEYSNLVKKSLECESLHEKSCKLDLSDEKKELIKPWSILSDTEKNLLRDYTSRVEEVYEAKEILDFKISSNEKSILKDVEELYPEAYSSWLKSCKARDESAYYIKEKMEDKLKLFIGNHSSSLLLNRATNHEMYELTKVQLSLEKRLNSCIAPLISDLFSGKEIIKNGKSFHIGENGSISIIAYGGKAGSFYNLETGENGGAFKLIQTKLGLDNKQCVAWVESFLHKQENVETDEVKELKKEWISSQPSSSDITKLRCSLVEEESTLIKTGKLSTMRSYYPYQNENGDLLFYTSISKWIKTPSERLSLPVSFGHDQEDKENLKWSTKGYLKMKKPLYNLPHIQINEKSLVLIVESEEAVEKAKIIFGKENIVCTTWSGAPKSIRKTDWAALKGRDVVIWPTNDSSGYGASHKVKEELRKACVNSVGVVDIKKLSDSFPESWDLSKVLPSSQGVEDLKNIVKETHKDTISIKKLSNKFNDLFLNDGKEDSFKNHRINDILIKIEKRIDPQINSNKLKVSVELSSILKNNIIIQLKKDDPSILYHIMNFYGITGSIPTQEKIEEIKNALMHLETPKDFKQFLDNPVKSDEIDTASKESMFSYAYDKAAFRFLESVVEKQQSVNKANNLFKRNVHDEFSHLCKRVEKEGFVKEWIKKNDPIKDFEILTMNPLRGIEKEVKENSPETISPVSSVTVGSRYGQYPHYEKQMDLAELKFKLKDNVEQLLNQLLPDEPMRRDRNGLRFGSNGSISVNTTEGVYFNYAKSEGGDLLKLIEKTTGGNWKDAVQWAKNFVGGNLESTIINKPYQYKPSKISDEWVSMIPETESNQPSFKDIASNNLNQKFQETDKHAYKDENGQLLFYIARVTEKEDPSKKGIFPMSYGYWKGCDNSPKWAIKGYHTEAKPLYNLTDLYENQQSKVLIVEGEKTTDAAKNLLSTDKYVCISWLGGSSTASKADWIHLHGREVVIWPDNDEAGYKAANDICKELRKIGAKSVSVVDERILSKEFPEKWDLADPLPSEKPYLSIKDLLLTAQEKSVGVSQFFSDYESVFKSKTNDSLTQKFRINDILHRVDERLRYSLTEKHGSKTWKIREEIYREVATIFNKKEDIEKDLISKVGSYDILVEKLSYQVMLYEAKTGFYPQKSTIMEMKELVSNPPKIDFDHLKIDNPIIKNDIQRYASDRALTVVIENGSYGISNEKHLANIFQKEAIIVSNQITNQIEKESSQKSVNTEKSMQRQLEI